MFYTATFHNGSLIQLKKSHWNDHNWVDIQSLKQAVDNLIESDGIICPSSINGISVNNAAEGLLLRLRDEWATVDGAFKTLDGFTCSDWSIQGLLADTVIFHAYALLLSFIAGPD